MDCLPVSMTVDLGFRLDTLKVNWEASVFLADANIL